jgi:hypothetical protein
MTPLPDGLSPLGRVAQCMNFERIGEKPPTLVTMDHRAVLVAAWAAKFEGRFDGRLPLLVRLDAHPDMGEKPRPWVWEKEQLADLDTVHAIVNATRHDDGGWVIAAMQYGLAGDVATFFVHEYHRYPGDEGPYVDHLGDRHRLWSLPSVKHLIENSEKRRRCGELLDRLREPDEPIWFDIDLDFATNRHEDGSPVAWRERDWAEMLDDASRELLAGCLSRAKLVTIAMEPWFCGGVAECGGIAAGLKRAFAPYGDWFSRL